MNGLSHTRNDYIQFKGSLKLHTRMGRHPKGSEEQGGTSFLNTPIHDLFNEINIH